MKNKVGCVLKARWTVVLVTILLSICFYNLLVEEVEAAEIQDVNYDTSVWRPHPLHGIWPIEKTGNPYQLEPGEIIVIRWFSFFNSKYPVILHPDTFHPSNNYGIFPEGFTHVKTEIDADIAYFYFEVTGGLGDYFVVDELVNEITFVHEGKTHTVEIDGVEEWNMIFDITPHQISVNIESDPDVKTIDEREIILSVEDPRNPGVNTNYGNLYYGWVHEDDYGTGESIDWNFFARTSTEPGLVPITEKDVNRNGNYYLLIRSIDENDNVAKEAYGPYNFVVDNSSISIYIFLMDYSPSKSIYRHGPTDDPVFFVYAEDSFSVIDSVYYEWKGTTGTINGGYFQAPDENPWWEGLIYDMPLSGGVYELEVTVTNEASQSKSYAIELFRDTTAPLIEYTLNPNADKSKKMHSMQLRVVSNTNDGSDTGETIHVYEAWSQSAATPAPEDWVLVNYDANWSEIVTPSELTDGSWYYHFKAVDDVGNETVDLVKLDDEVHAFVIDNTPPVLHFDEGIIACESGLPCVDVPVDRRERLWVNLPFTVTDMHDVTIRVSATHYPVMQPFYDPFIVTGNTLYFDDFIQYTGDIYFYIEAVDEAGNMKRYLTKGFYLLKDIGIDASVWSVEGETVSTTKEKWFDAKFYYRKIGVEPPDVLKIEYSVDGSDWVEHYVTGWGPSDYSTWIPDLSMALDRLPLPEDIQEPEINEFNELTVRFYDEIDNYVIDSVQFIYDNTPPVIDVDQISYDPSTDTIGEVTVTVPYSDRGNSHEAKFTFYENVTDHVITVQDEAGNTSSTTISIDWILGTKVTYSPATWTNQSVTATIEFDDPVTFEGESTKVKTKVVNIQKNGTTTLNFTVTSDSGEEVEQRINLIVDWIDKTPPTGMIFYEMGAKGGVVAKLIATDDSGEPVVMVDKEGNETGGDGTYTFYENGTYTFYFKDAAGNVASATAEMNLIDTTPPNLSVSYSTKELTNGTVRAVVAADEPIVITKIIVNNVELDGNKFYDFIENGEAIFVAVDRSGNESSILAKVDYIDKVAPNVQVTLSTEKKTNKHVIATISADEPIVVINNRGLTERVFQDNGSFTFIVSDLAGNIVEVPVTVGNIDRSVAQYRLEYSNVDKVTGEASITNNNITVTVVPLDPFDYIENDGIAIFDRNGMKWLRARDAVGNEMVIEIVVQWIDKEAPKITIPGHIVMPQNGAIPDLMAGVTAIDNYSVDSLNVTHHIDPSIPGQYEVTYTATDVVGNESSVKRTVLVVDGSELSVYVNGQVADKTLSIRSHVLNIDVYGAQGEWEIMSGPGQLRIGEFKNDTHAHHGMTIEIDTQGYYTILVRDQELNYQLIEVYIIPALGKGE